MQVAGRQQSAPGTKTGRYSVAPSPMSRVSMLPPCEPGEPQGTGAPDGATPMTPIIGRTGTLAPATRANSPSIGTTRTTCLRTGRAERRSRRSRPSPRAATSIRLDEHRQHVTGLRALDEDGPGGGVDVLPVDAGRRGVGRRIWSLKQSAVSSRTLSPGRIRATGTASADRLNTLFSRATWITTDHPFVFGHLVPSAPSNEQMRRSDRRHAGRPGCRSRHLASAAHLL